MVRRGLLASETMDLVKSLLINREEIRDHLICGKEEKPMAEFQEI